MPTWSTVITAVSIPSTIAVYGNGKVLGLTNGSKNGGLELADVDRNSRMVIESKYNTNVSTSSTTETGLTGCFGLTTDTSGKSGIVAKSNSITRTSKTYKFCIKY